MRYCSNKKAQVVSSVEGLSLSVNYRSGTNVDGFKNDNKCCFKLTYAFIATLASYAN